MQIKFLTEPAILLEPDKILVIADLHIGIEHDIFKSGITIPSQIEKIQSRIEKLIKETKAKHLILLGDIKHQVPGVSWQEQREIPELLENLSKKVKISIVKGNHDGDIEKIVHGIDIYDPSGFKIKDFGFVHGQAWPDISLLDCKTIITAHIHPAIEFWSSGFRAIEPCWIHCQIDEKKIKKRYNLSSNLEKAIIMPAFNHLIGGMALNSEKFEPMGPLLTNKVMMWENSDIYLLDGTYLGKLTNLKIK